MVPPSTPQPQDSSETDADSDGIAIEDVDWEEVDGRQRRLSAERVVLAAGVLLWAVVAAHHETSGDTYLVRPWIVGPEDWLLLLGLVVIVAYGIVPLIKRRDRLGATVAMLRGRLEATLSLVVLLVVVALGFRGTITRPYPELTLDAYHPPVGFTARKFAGECAGETSGKGAAVACHGVWDYPLGTHRLGYEMTDLLVIGAKPTAYIVIVTVGLIVPLAVWVGILAGYHGGLLDDLLMAYVDAQLSLPAMLVYLFAFMFVADSIFVFLVAFGLLSWGGIARIVRSETLKRREEGYVRSARAVGAPSGYVLRRHILPNVTNSIVPATFHLIAIVILTEAALSFLGFTPIEWSWGETTARGLQHHPPLDIWWTSTFPALALALTVVSCKIAGDHLRDVFDPRRGQTR